MRFCFDDNVGYLANILEADVCARLLKDRLRLKGLLFVNLLRLGLVEGHVLEDVRLSATLLHVGQ